MKKIAYVFVIAAFACDQGGDNGAPENQFDTNVPQQVEAEQNPVEQAVDDKVFEEEVIEDKFVVNASEEQPTQIAYSSCLDVQTKVIGAPSGVYPLYYTNAADEILIMDAYCDMDNEGGGWTMILNYVHLNNTNPLLNIRADSFPLLNSNQLGDDEQNTAFWGHLNPSLVAQFNFTELRFFCRTSGHNRVLHFKTDLTTCLDIARTGEGSCNGVENSFTALGGHTANLPASNNNARMNSGVTALTETTLRYTDNNNVSIDHWTVRAAQGNDDWECDDDPDDARNNTIHRVWFR